MTLLQFYFMFVFIFLATTPSSPAILTFDMKLKMAVKEGEFNISYDLTL